MSSVPCKPRKGNAPHHAFRPCGEHEEVVQRCHKWAMCITEMHLCAICSNRQFVSSEALFQHSRSSKKLHFFCEPCRLVFSNGNGLEAHKEAVHSSISCQLCNLYFPSEEGLQVHYRDSSTHTSCRLCGAGFIDRNACTNHVRQHHGQIRKRRRRGCRSPSSSVDGISSRSFSSLSRSSQRNSRTPESSVHTPVTVHTPVLNGPSDDEDAWLDREDEEDEDEAAPIVEHYVSPLRSTSPEQLDMSDTPRPPSKQLLQPSLRRKETPEDNSSASLIQTDVSSSSTVTPSRPIVIPSPIGIPAKPRRRPLTKESNSAEGNTKEHSTSFQSADSSVFSTIAGVTTEGRTGEHHGDINTEMPLVPPVMAESDPGLNRNFTKLVNGQVSSVTEVSSDTPRPLAKLLQEDQKRKSSLENSPVEPLPQAIFSPSWRPAPSHLVTGSNLISIPPKQRLRLSSSGGHDIEYSPVESRLLSHLNNPSTPLLEAEMPFPPGDPFAGMDVDDDEIDWDSRPVIPPILAGSDPDIGQLAVDGHPSETGDPSEYVNPFVNDAELSIIPPSINIDSDVPSDPDTALDNVPSISPVVAPSRQFSVTLPIIREASEIPLPSDSDSDDGHGPRTTASDFANAFCSVTDPSPMPSLRSLPAIEFHDAFDGDDDFSYYAGSSVCPSPIDIEQLEKLAREICRERSGDSLFLTDSFADYGSSEEGSLTRAQAQFDAQQSTRAAALLGLHDGDFRRQVQAVQPELHEQDFAYIDQEHGNEMSTLDRPSDFANVREHVEHSEIPPFVLENIADLDTHISPSAAFTIERNRTSPPRTRSSSREMRTSSRVGREGYQSNSGHTSRHSRSSSQSFNHSFDEETHMTSPVSPKDSPFPESMSLQNPRGPRFHCRLCMVEPCVDATATFCGHIFCNSCITEEIMETSRCPVCNAPTLLYCLFRLDLLT